MANIVVESILDDYVFVVGIIQGVSKNTNKPYSILQLLSPIIYGDVRQGFACSTLSISAELLKQYNIEVGDMLQFLYVGTGEFKKLKHIDVVKGVPFKDKK